MATKGRSPMSTISTTSPAATIESVKVPAWAWALLAFAVFAIFFISQENGAILGTQAGQMLHELTHDARHALGVPCH